jgi:uncharacterized coiled-coil protein SlyX
MNHTLRQLLIPLALTCFALSPAARAVTPAPDGGYPGNNTAEGTDALFSLDTSLGVNNTALGFDALYNDTTGGGNTGVGAFAVFTNQVGNSNTAVGNAALFFNTATDNTALGGAALYNNTSGNSNIAVGVSAGYNLTTGSNNIDISDMGVAGESATIRIGTKGIQRKTFIAGIYGATTSGGIPVYINSAGKLGTTTSSARFKQNIRDMGEVSDVLLSLRPVAFRYKPEIEPEAVPQFGLVAEEVEKVDPDLVVRDSDGKPYTVRYDAVNAMLLNEFLKAHRKAQEQQATIAELRSTIAQQQKGMEALAVQVKEQSAQIQRVRAEMAASRPAPQFVLNNP